MMVRSRQQVRREEVAVTGGAVAATRALEAEAGAECLKEGGSAVDAAIAAAFMAAVVEPFSTSIGGCGFMLVHDPAGSKCWSIEFPTLAPAAAQPDMFKVIGDSPSGMLATEAVEGNANAFGFRSCGVPASVAGLVEAHRMFGRLPLARLVAPAVKVAREGFASDIYYDSLAAAFKPVLAMFDKSAANLLHRGEPPVSLYGHRIAQPALADALEEIGADGGTSFYRGDVARAIVADVAAGGGILSLDDLATYAPRVGEPLWGSYRGRRVAVPASPCGGWTVLQTLRLLERFDLPALPRASAERFHLVIAALRHAFADRYAWAGDPAFGAVPLGTMLSDAYADEIAALIDAARLDPALQTEAEPWVAFREAPLHDPWVYSGEARPQSQPGTGPGSPQGTVHVTAADASGMLVTCTHTIGDVFGAKCMAGPGVLLNSGMQWFSPRPGGPNAIAPRKRPLANMAPAMVYGADGGVMGTGAFGGRRIISAIVQIISDVVDHGLSPQQACEAGRIDASERTTFVSDRLGDALPGTLTEKGHRVKAVREDHHLLGVEFANVTAIARDPEGVMRCGVDAIRPCEAIGF